MDFTPLQAQLNLGLGLGLSRGGLVLRHSSLCRQVSVSCLLMGRPDTTFRKMPRAAAVFRKVWNTSVGCNKGWPLDHEDWRCIKDREASRHQLSLCGSLSYSHLLSLLCESPRLSESSTKYTNTRRNKQINSRTAWELGGQAWAANFGS